MRQPDNLRAVAVGDMPTSDARGLDAASSPAALAQLMAPFGGSLHGVLLSHPDGRVVAANPAACRFLRRDSLEICALGRAGLADPTDERWGAAVAIRAEHGAFRGRLRFLRGDGSTFTADVSSALFLRGGQPWTYVLFDDASEVDAALEAAARQQAYADVVVEMLDSISDAYFSIDENWRITFFNREAESLLSVRREDVLGKDLWDTFPTARDTIFQHQYEHAIRTQESVTFEGYYPGTDLRCEVRAYPVKGGGLAVYFLDVGDRYSVLSERERILEAERSARAVAESALATAERARAELAARAATDDLTGLLNRAGLAKAMKQALQAPDVAVCLLLADLDNLKLVNDTLGHEVGDRVLQRFADDLREIAGPTAMLARLGSDEFAIAVLGDATQEVDALAERTLQMARRPVEVDGHSLLLTASIGLARMPKGDPDLGRLLRHADAARYRAKRDGRDQAAWFDDALHTQAVERVVLERELRTAIESRALTVHFQPEFDLRTGRAVDVEALARWTSPTRGPISPAVFVPIAEESGLIRALGDQILDVSATQAACWGAKENVRTWVNVSPRQLATMGLADRIEALLHRIDLAPQRLGIEVTESSLIEERRFADELRAIRRLGVGLAIDDFGTGYSSFSRLAGMPVDLVKIDRSFISSADSARGRSLLQGMVTLGHSLGARVTAEGVETREQLQRVIDAGFDSAAGYLLQRPVEPQDVVWSTDLS
ncbi:putative bifunctional diguanylate cyclase/phosphodiesterase [Demequina sp. SO4-18]|uniref:putative bifunctional diguanylate cyclase/phosphodiesterase n=1 Tax=Demequina sp. SO4-18 TaxID=3401026 RepID=UPI003B5AB257